MCIYILYTCCNFVYFQDNLCKTLEVRLIFLFINSFWIFPVVGYVYFVVLLEVQLLDIPAIEIYNRYNATYIISLLLF